MRRLCWFLGGIIAGTYVAQYLGVYLYEYVGGVFTRRRK